MTVKGLYFFDGGTLEMGKGINSHLHFDYYYRHRDVNYIYA